MANLAIKGHATRGKKVIEILEMLGGSNPHNYCADCDSLCFTIGKGTNIIYYDWVKECYEDEDTLVFTLEEFLEKFPYKVGDKVKVKETGKDVTIEGMSWRNGCEVIYDTCYNNDCVAFYSAEELQPYKEEVMAKANKAVFDANAQCCDIMNHLIKEETMESKPNILQQLKEYFDNTPRDVIEKEWEELSHLNEIGPTVDEYLESVRKYRQANQYPRTYKECAKILDCFSAFHIDGYKNELLEVFQELLICRAAYWKIAGEQMGLGKPWKPDLKNEELYCIQNYNNQIVKSKTNTAFNKILIFPTEEMRDVFIENFGYLIELCKELL